ncbi:MAG: hypothetical protein AAFR49_10905 [Pseudomonadota bacterium]
MADDALKRYVLWIRSAPPRSMKHFHAASRVADDVLRVYSTQPIFGLYSFRVPRFWRFLLLHSIIVISCQMFFNIGTVFFHETHEFGRRGIPPHFEYDGYHFHFYHLRELIGVSVAVVIFSMPLDWINTTKTLTIRSIDIETWYYKILLFIADVLLTLIIAASSAGLILTTAFPRRVAVFLGGANPFSDFVEVFIPLVEAVLIGFIVTMVLLILSAIMYFATFLIKTAESFGRIRLFILENSRFEEKPLSITAVGACFIFAFLYIIVMLTMVLV